MRTTCIILAGGLGTRLREAVPGKPKCLAPVGETSFLELQLRLLRAQGITDFVLSLGYLADQVLDEISHIQSDFTIRHVIEQKALGTGGAILFAMNTLGIDEALITNGDTYLSGDLSSLLAPLDLARNELCRMAVIQVDNVSRFGGVEIHNNLVTRFTEKGNPGPGRINAGFYRTCQQAFDKYHLDPGQQFSFETDLMPQLTRNSEVTATVISGDFTDIGVPDDYRNFCRTYEKN